MTVLSIYSAQHPEQYSCYSELSDIQSHLHSLGVRFERWETACELSNEVDQEAILVKYCDPIAKLKEKFLFQSIDVIRVQPNQEGKEEIRKKFLAEHIHEDFEIRFFIEGRGLFYLHVADKVYGVLCEQGDLISVPANTKHWFDMGAQPEFTCIRFFTTPYGWVANFTGDSIAEKFPTLEQFVAKLS